MKRSFLLGLALGFLLLGCVSASLGYKYYGLEADSYGGKLLGPKIEDDVPFSECKPDEVSKGKCVVMLVKEFKAMASELLSCRSALSDCQKQCQAK